MAYTLTQAAKAIGRNKTTVLRAIKSGKVSAIRDEASGGWLIEPVELHRVYAPVSTSTAAAASRIRGKATPRNGNATGELRELLLRLETAEVRIADKDAAIDDLRRRLDQSEEERRQAQAQVAALLTDRREPQSRRRWWPFARQA